MADKVVLITEQSNPINVVDKDNYILEGIFAVFGKENVNHRIYDEKEYMPHLEYLQEKIARHKLAGELDHPEKFDVSLQNISHLVEKLWYDKDTRTLKGRIRILDTDPAGMNARKLMDAGFPLSISSRAAGVVKDDKHVEIKRIFTYDLVADGGFGNEAELERVKESVDQNPELKALYESVSVEPQLTSYKTNFDNIRVYDVTEKYPDLLMEGANFEKYDLGYSGSAKEVNKAPEFDYSDNKISAEKSFKTEFTPEDKGIEIEPIDEPVKTINIKNEKDVKINKKILNKITESEMANNVTVEDMAKYSRYVKEQVENLESQIAELKHSSRPIRESKGSSSRVAALEEKLDSLIAYTNALVEEHNQIIKFQDKFVGEHNALANKFKAYESHSDKFVEEHNNLVKYCEAIANENEQIKGYLNEEVRPTMESSIKYSEYIAKNLEECASYLDNEVAFNINKQHEYLDVVAENVNNILKYQDYLAEKANEVHAYADYLGENVASKEDLENAIGYTEYVAEHAQEKFSRNEKVNESNSYGSLDSKIDEILESVKIKRAAALLETSKYPYAKNFDSEQMRKFNSLNEAQKEMVSRNIATSSNVDRVLNEAATMNSQEAWITHMPAEYASAWNALNESEKSAIAAQARLYRLDAKNEYAIKNFWQTRGLEEKAAQSLNESKEEAIDLGGYNTDYLKKVLKESKKFI